MVAEDKSGAEIIGSATKVFAEQLPNHFWKWYGKVTVAGYLFRRTYCPSCQPFLLITLNDRIRKSGNQLLFCGLLLTALCIFIFTYLHVNLRSCFLTAAGELLLWSYWSVWCRRLLYHLCLFGPASGSNTLFVFLRKVSSGWHENCINYSNTNKNNILFIDAITDHVCNENHVIDWVNAKVIDRESDKDDRLIKEEIWIRKTDNMNRDEGSYQLSHVWDKLLHTDDWHQKSVLMKASDVKPKCR